MTSGIPTSEAEVAARGVFKAIDSRDLSAIATFLHPDDVQDFMPLGRAVGRAAVLDVFDQLFRSFPDMSIEVEDVFAAHARAYVRWHARGRFTGAPYLGILATGRAVEIRGVDAFIQLEDGLVRHNTIFYDGAAFARGVGLLPTNGSWAERAVLAVFNTRTRLARLFQPKRSST